TVSGFLPRFVRSLEAADTQPYLAAGVVNADDGTSRTRFVAKIGPSIVYVHFRLQLDPHASYRAHISRPPITVAKVSRKNALLRQEKRNLSNRVSTSWKKIGQ